MKFANANPFGSWYMLNYSEYDSFPNANYGISKIDVMSAAAAII